MLYENLVKGLNRACKFVGQTHQNIQSEKRKKNHCNRNQTQIHVLMLVLNEIRPRWNNSAIMILYVKMVIGLVAAAKTAELAAAGYSWQWMNQLQGEPIVPDHLHVDIEPKSLIHQHQA